MLDLIDFSAFGDPRRAKANFYVSVGLGLIALGLFFGFKEHKLALTCVGMIFTLWLPSGHGIPVDLSLADTAQPKPAAPAASAPAATQPGIPPSVIVGCLLFALGMGACGVSTYAKRQKAAEGYQEESAEKQKQESDRLTKLGYFACNAWSDRSMRGAQGVMDANLEIAKGTAGAAEKRAFWETWADKLHKTMLRYCELADDTATLLKGAPFDELPPLAPPGPAQPAAPSVPPAEPAPAPPAPVSLPSPLQPPAPLPPLAPPAMPAPPPPASPTPSPALPQPPAVP